MLKILPMDEYLRTQSLLEHATGEIIRHSPRQIASAQQVFSSSNDHRIVNMLGHRTLPIDIVDT